MLLETALARYMRRLTKSILEFTPRDNTGVSFRPAARKDRPYLLYVHIPFCEQLCPYCSFHRIKVEDSLVREYFRYLLREVDIYHDLGFRFSEVYVGGGTPTVRPALLEELIGRIRQLWPIDRISVETNPNHLRPEILGRLRRSGVTRLSVGVQSFDDRILECIGRLSAYGSGQAIAERLEAAAGVFDTLNVDLIFNFPSQTEAILREDLRRVLELEPDQVTCYPLMAGRRTRRRIEQLGRVPYNREKRFYRIIRSTLEGQYCLSSAWCFSHRRRTGALIDEYIVEHEEYAGLGAGSFGYLDDTIYSNAFSLPTYLDLLRRGRLPVVASRRFGRRQQIRYDLLMKLLGTSLDLSRLRAKYGRAVASYLWKELIALRLAGALRRVGDHYVLTRRGQYLWVVLMREFFVGVNNFRESSLALTPRSSSA
jgi:coproporphyrinogen III oxidase-like Fe-S oxidoreductase